MVVLLLPSCVRDLDRFVWFFRGRRRGSADTHAAASALARTTPSARLATHACDGMPALRAHSNTSTTDEIIVDVCSSRSMRLFARETRVTKQPCIH